MQSEVDYRMVQNRNASKDTQQVFFVADQDKGIKSGAQFERLWDRLSKGQTVNDMVLRLQVSFLCDVIVNVSLLWVVLPRVVDIASFN